MDKIVRVALDESIDDWERRAKGEDLGSKQCPLCILGINKERLENSKCTDCIIKKRTGKFYCHETPYWDWHRERNPTSKLLYADDEVVFLKSFLPKEEKKFGIEVGDAVEINDYSYSFKLEGKELKPYFIHYSKYDDNFKVVATDLILPAVEGSSSINREQTNDTLLQESTGKYYVFIQKRFLKLVEKKNEEKKYCSECGRVK